MTRTTARLAGALLAGALLLAGCGDGAGESAHEGPMRGHGDSARSESREATFNDTDVAFVRGMIPHHRQAIEMSRLAESRAADPRVLDLAERIEAAQQPEIETLSGWLDQWGVDMGHPEDRMGGDMGHGAAGMGGMMSEDDMQALAAASGAEFDRLFLEQMVAHHTGAVDMADTEIDDGRNADAVALAESIRADQSAEIAEMERLLTELGD
jgi:uncharacterized protein (DUF305 family)